MEDLESKGSNSANGRKLSRQPDRPGRMLGDSSSPVPEARMSL